jgi:hypothetical protein
MSTFTSEPGIRLGGRYRLEDRIAAAGGWSAWKAIDEILARPVSVIMFAAGFPRLEQVITAARAASRLGDTRLMQVFDVEDSFEHGYVVLEWPVGETLADLVSAGALEPMAGARIVAEAADAMSGAHAAGLAHLCLRPDAVRWTAGGGVKITGLGIDAALEGITADDPVRADTEGLGKVLYATITGMWPGPDYPDLPMAPTLDGQPRRPRQVRAGVPAALDEVASRALSLNGHDGHAYGSPGEVASALRAVLPPVQVPAAPPRSRDRESMPRQQAQPVTDGMSPGYRYRQYQPGPPPRRRSPGRVVAMTIAVLVAVVGVSAAAVHLLHQPHTPGHPGSSGKSGTGTPATAKLVTLRIVKAHGFDALESAANDPTDENTSQAMNVLIPGSQGWSTEYYFGKEGPYFGGYKTGTGLILTLAGTARVDTVTVKFGTIPGANVEILVGKSATRSAANLHSMTEIASATDVGGGSHTFDATTPATGRYVVIWFTKLPRMAGSSNKFMATVYSVSIRGTD